VYYLNYPCQKLVAWRVVYKLNLREQLYTHIDATYHFDDEYVDEIYQEEELSTYFVVEPGAALDSLDGEGVDVTVLRKQK
jgi:kynurenine formamidase